MMDFFFPVAIGILTGTLSSCGLGGGTLLLLYLVECSSLSQVEAQGVNLLCFLPMAAISSYAHYKSGFLQRDVLKHAIRGGLFGVICGAVLTHALPMDYLRKGFSLLLLLLGSTTLYQSGKQAQEDPSDTLP